ncbi:hypothetical protein [Criblamydia sequanensis]|uniref:hypothetical protein n=1 Tax=Candidatus Criblamydia sequanensis TaxID=340071 RepID=UPI001929DB58|nr:hypothetical protein [Criblamydia sequanensis]
MGPTVWELEGPMPIENKLKMLIATYGSFFLIFELSKAKEFEYEVLKREIILLYHLIYENANS